MNLICMKMNLQAEHIFIWMASDEYSFETEAKLNSEIFLLRDISKALCNYVFEH